MKGVFSTFAAMVGLLWPAATLFAQAGEQGSQDWTQGIAKMVEQVPSSRTRWKVEVEMAPDPEMAARMRKAAQKNLEKMPPEKQAKAKEIYDRTADEFLKPQQVHKEIELDYFEPGKFHGVIKFLGLRDLIQFEIFSANDGLVYVVDDRERTVLLNRLRSTSLRQLGVGLPALFCREFVGDVGKVKVREESEKRVVLECVSTSGQRVVRLTLAKPSLAPSLLEEFMLQANRDPDPGTESDKLLPKCELSAFDFDSNDPKSFPKKVIYKELKHDGSVRSMETWTLIEGETPSPSQPGCCRCILKRGYTVTDHSGQEEKTYRIKN